MKKIIFILITFLTCFSVNAEIIETSNIDSYEEAINKRLLLENENYGVKKPAKMTSESIRDIKETPYVSASDKVYDFSSVLTSEQKEDLKQKAYEFLDETGIELIIVTIDKEFSDYQIEKFADNFFDFNDFGISNSKSYDGILVVRNTNNYNRYYLYGN